MNEYHWYDVPGDTMPLRGHEVLIHQLTRSGSLICPAALNEDGVFMDGEGYKYTPTHWSFMPNPPYTMFEDGEWSDCPGTPQFFSADTVWNKICQYHATIPNLRDSQITLDLVFKLMSVRMKPSEILNWAIKNDTTAIDKYIDPLK